MLWNQFCANFYFSERLTYVMIFNDFMILETLVSNTVSRIWNQIYNSYKHATLISFMELLQWSKNQGKQVKRTWTKVKRLVLSVLSTQHFLIFQCKSPSVQKPFFKANQRTTSNLSVWIISFCLSETWTLTYRIIKQNFNADIN